MRGQRGSSLALFIGLALLVGCAPTAEQKLVGKWQGKIVVDQEKLMQDSRLAGNPFAAALAGQAANLAASLQPIYQFNADGTGRFQMPALLQTIEASGRWRVVSSEGDTATIEVTPEGKPSFTSRLRFVDGDHIVVDQDNVTIEFTRVRD